MSSTNVEALRLTRQWLEQVVVGLGLCPFAAKPLLEKRIRIELCDCTNELDLLEKLHDELSLLNERPASELETTLLVMSNMLSDFADYNQFLDRVDALLAQFGWEGQYQVASFHPQYCFAGVDPADAENLTNRSPFPVLHLIREASLAAVLAHVEHPEQIPEDNIRRMHALSAEQRLALFPWLAC
jgi:uncharacterized protein